MQLIPKLQGVCQEHRAWLGPRHFHWPPTATVNRDDVLLGPYSRKQRPPQSTGGSVHEVLGTSHDPPCMNPGASLSRRHPIRCISFHHGQVWSEVQAPRSTTGVQTRPLEPEFWEAALGLHCLTYSLRRAPWAGHVSPVTSGEPLEASPSLSLTIYEMEVSGFTPRGCSELTGGPV